jgi:tetratricopeptide (TPR) repeat protein
MKLKLIQLIVCFFLSISSSLYAGVASLTDTEVLRLKALVQSSPEGRTWMKVIIQHAQEGLALPPHPIDQMEVEGQLEGSQAKTQSVDAKKDFQRLQYLGLAYALTADERYLNQAAAYLTAWAKTCLPPSNPINATQFESFLTTYDLLRPHMTGPDKKTLDDWLDSTADALRRADNPTKLTHTNNHHAHLLKTVAQVAFILDDKDLEDETLKALKAYLEINLNDDGTTLDFEQRDALHYHVYDLAPLALAAILYQRGRQEDLYNYNTFKGASVSQCVAFVLPYAKGEKTHAEFVNSTVAFDLRRGNNGEAAYIPGHDFIHKEAIPCLEMSQYFQPELRGLVGTLVNKPGSAYPTLQCLLNEAMRTGPLPAASNPVLSGSGMDAITESDYRLALGDFQQGQYAQAVSAFQKVTQEDPDSWQAYQGMGSAHLKLGDKDAALHDYQRSLDLNPDNPPVKAVFDKLEDELIPAP